MAFLESVLAVGRWSNVLLLRFDIAFALDMAAYVSTTARNSIHPIGRSDEKQRERAWAK